MTQLLEVPQQKKPSPVRKYAILLAFPAALLWMEIIIKIWNFRTVWNRGLFYTALFTMAIGLFCSLICSIGRYKGNRRLSLLLLGGLTVIYIVQAVYYTVMRTVPAVYSATVAGDATEFWRVGVFGFWRTIPAILFLIVPFVLLCVFGRKHTPDHLLGKRAIVAVLAIAIGFHGAGMGCVFLSNGGILNPWSIYREQTNPEMTMSNFGVLTALRLSLRDSLFVSTEAAELREPEDAPRELGGEDSGEEDGYAPNVLDIDFRALEQSESDETLRSLHHFFAKRRPTQQNEYTGVFAGKNLILITAEAFHSWAIDPERTPTLYQLSNQGFVCENFYTPLWWVSTSDGEYFSLTSLLPKAGEQSFAVAAENSLPFCLGNQLGALGYATNAYHNHTYTYYQRHLSHPNMGYDFKGVGNGLDISPLWPESDVEMVEASLPDFLGEAPFHTYYLTVSGHLQYFFDQNDMAQKHRAAVEDLDLSEEAQAYLACQMELDQALEYLLAQLEEAGELENTVICLYGDHYPYGLSRGAMEELGGEGIQDSLELYHSNLILWSADMEEPITIEKPCSNLDVLPTLSNLFGLSCDSRLLMGRDILSTEPGLVVFSDASYITDYGVYEAKNDEFIPAEGAELPEWYAVAALKNVQDMFYYSALMLETDYYGKILP